MAARTYLPGLLLAACATLTSCTSSGAPHGAASASSPARSAEAPGTGVLRSGTAPKPVTVRDTLARTPYVFTDIRLCTTGGPIAIRAVQPVAAHGVTLLEWGVRAMGTDATAPSGLPGRLADFPGFAHTAVSTPCSERGQATELGITLRKAKPVTATVGGFSVSYAAGGTSHTLRQAYLVTLCTAGEKKNARCR